MNMKYTTIAVAVLFLLTPLAAVTLMTADANHPGPDTDTTTFDPSDDLSVTATGSTNMLLGAGAGPGASVTDDGLVTVTLSGVNAASHADGSFDGSASANQGKVMVWTNIGWGQSLFGITTDTLTADDLTGYDPTGPNPLPPPVDQSTACPVQISGPPQDSGPFEFIQTRASVGDAGDLTYSFDLAECAEVYDGDSGVSRYQRGPFPSIYVSVENGGGGWHPQTYFNAFNPTGATWNVATIPDPTSVAAYDAERPLNAEFEYVDDGNGQSVPIEPQDDLVQTPGTPSGSSTYYDLATPPWQLVVHCPGVPCVDPSAQQVEDTTHRTSSKYAVDRALQIDAPVHATSLRYPGQDEAGVHRVSFDYVGEGFQPKIQYTVSGTLTGTIGFGLAPFGTTTTPDPGTYTLQPGDTVHIAAWGTSQSGTATPSSFGWDVHDEGEFDVLVKDGNGDQKYFARAMKTGPDGYANHDYLEFLNAIGISGITGGPGSWQLDDFTIDALGADSGPDTFLIDNFHFVGPAGSGQTTNLVSAVQTPDGFVADFDFTSTSLPATAETAPALAVTRGQNLIVQVTAWTDDGTGFAINDKLDLGLALAVDCGSLMPLLDPEGDDVCTDGADHLFVRASAEADPDGVYAFTIPYEEAEMLFPTDVPLTFLHVMAVDNRPGGNRVSHFAPTTDALVEASAYDQADLMDETVWEPVPTVDLSPALDSTGCDGTCDLNDGWFHIITPQNAIVADGGHEIVVRPDADGAYVFHQEVFVIDSSNDNKFVRINLENGPGVKSAYLAFNTASEAAANADSLDPAGVGEVFATSDGQFLHDGEAKEYRITYDTLLANGMIVGDPNDPSASGALILEPTALWSGVWYSPASAPGSDTRVGWDEGNTDACEAAPGNMMPVSSVCPESGGFFNLIKNELVGEEGDNGAAMKNVAGFIDVPDLFEYFITPVSASANAVANHYLYIDTPNAHTPDCTEAFPMDIVCRLMYAADVLQNDNYGELTTGNDDTIDLFAMPYTNDGDVAGGLPPESDVLDVTFFATQTTLPPGAPFDALVTEPGTVELGAGEFNPAWNDPDGDGDADGAYVLQLSEAELSKPLIDGLGASPGEEITFYVYAQANDLTGVPVPGKAGAYGWQKATFHLGGAYPMANAANNLASPLAFTLPDRQILVDPTELLFAEGDDPTTPGFGEYEISLSTQPEGDVVIDLAVDPATAPFDLRDCTSGTDISQVILSDTTSACVRVQHSSPDEVDNKDADGDDISLWEAQILHTVDTETTDGDEATQDAAYAALTDIDPVDVTAVDDEGAGVTITETEDSTDLVEGVPLTDTYDVVLNALPAEPVIVKVEPNEEETVASDTGSPDGDNVLLLFTPSNWNVAQTVKVTAVDDGDAEGTPDQYGLAFDMGLIEHTASSSDPGYPKSLFIRDVEPSIEDNDWPRIVATPSGGSMDVAEDGSKTDSYTIVLQAGPSGPGSFVDVLVCGDSEVTLTAPGETGASDGPFAPGESCADPEGTETFDPQLRIRFTDEDWDEPRTVSVAAFNDKIDEDPSHSGKIFHQVGAVTTESGFDGLQAPPIDVVVTDDDTAGISLSTTSVSVNEKDSNGEPTSDTYDIVLDSEPTDPVQVKFTFDGDQITLEGPGGAIAPNGEIAISSAGPHSIKVTAKDDPAAELNPHGVTIGHTLRSDDTTYDQFELGTVAVSITDDDTKGILLEHTDGETRVEEGGDTDDYTVRLTSQPSGDVEVKISPDVEVTVNPATLTFTDQTWDTPQTVRVTAFDDKIDEGTDHPSTIAHDVSVGDYAGVSNTLDVTVVDNDESGIVFETDDGVEVSEGGTSDSYDVSLATEPTHDVTITITTDGQTTVSPASITFTPTTWAESKSIAVTAVDDSDIEDVTHDSVITHKASSDDDAFNDKEASITAEVTDNDAPPLLVDESDDSTVVTEGGDGDSFTVRLSQEPNGNAVVRVAVTDTPPAQTAVSSDDGRQVSPTVVEFFFTPFDYDQPRTVNVEAVDDTDSEALEHDSQIVVSVEAQASSPDPRETTAEKYKSTPDVPVDVTVKDNDVARVVLSEDSLEVAEHPGDGPTSATYTVHLNKKPQEDSPVAVTITETSPDITFSEGDANCFSAAEEKVDLVFGEESYDTPQEVTVFACDDGTPEGPHSAQLTHSVSTSDTRYNDIAPFDLPVSIIDDDEITISVEATDPEAAEDGEDPGVFTITRHGPTDKSNPTTVYFSLGGSADAGDDYDDPGTSATIAAHDSSVTVAIEPIDDDVDEGGDEDVILTLQSDPTDADAYEIHPDPAQQQATVTIAEDDDVGVSVTESDGSTVVVEGGQSDTYTLVLDTEPTNMVTITVKPGTEISVNAAGQAGAAPSTTTPGDWTITFTVDDWNQERTITVSAEDDFEPEGPETSTITHTISSGDPDYADLSVDSVEVVIVDNEGGSAACDRDLPVWVCRDDSPGPVTGLVGQDAIEIRVGPISLRL